MVLIAQEEDSELESSLPQEIAISVATLAEFHFGVLVAKDDETRQLRLRRLGIIEATLQPIPIDVPIARAFAAVAVRAAGAVIRTDARRRNGRRRGGWGPAEAGP